MLILSRKVGQGIRIGDAITVTVMAVDGAHVRLGLDAPATCKILREELWRSIARDNAAAAGAGVPPGAFAQLLRHNTADAPASPPSRGSDFDESCGRSPCGLDGS